MRIRLRKASALYKQHGAEPSLYFCNILIPRRRMHVYCIMSERKGKITKQGDELPTILMDVLTGLQHDIWHNIVTPGSYEWWYFDAESTDGEWMLTAIFFDGIPMSPYYLDAYEQGQKPRARDYRGYVFSLYHQGKRVAYCFHQTDAEHSAPSDEVIDIRILDSGCKFEQDVFKVEIDTLRRSKHQSLVVNLSFVPLSFPVTSHASTPVTLPANSPATDSNTNEAHSWVIVAPNCTVLGSIEVHEYATPMLQIDFQGKGYHDHNFGLRPLYEDWGAWYWGRIHTPDGVIIFYLTASHNTNRNANRNAVHERVRWVGMVRDTGVEQFEEVEFIEAEKRSTRFLLGYHKSLSISAKQANGSRIYLRVRLDKCLENGPFYLRFISDVEIQSDKGKHNASCITEYYQPQRLRNPLVKAMVRTPFMIFGESAEELP